MKSIFRTAAWIWVSLLSVLVGSVQVEAAEEDSFSEAELEQLLAPVALYPDTVLSQLLMAATYPLEVVMAARWSRDHPQLSGEDAVEAVEDEDWDPSVKALVAFPELLQRMSEDLEWTQQVGDAFVSDEAAVMDSVQNLRRRAYDAGSLDDLEHLTASRRERHIVIEPVVREVIYIPYYDTTRIYGSWRWSGYPPCRWDRRHGHHYSRRVYWGPGIHLSWSFFFSAFRWDHHHVVVIDRAYGEWGHRAFWSDRDIAHHRHARRWRHDGRHDRGRHWEGGRHSSGADYSADNLNRHQHGQEPHRGKRLLLARPAAAPTRAWKGADHQRRVISRDESREQNSPLGRESGGKPVKRSQFQPESGGRIVKRSQLQGASQRPEAERVQQRSRPGAHPVRPVRKPQWRGRQKIELR